MCWHQSIMVVDDKKLVDMVTRLLELEGYELLAGINGSSALAIVNHCQPSAAPIDIIVLDVDGYTACYYIRQLVNIPITMVTTSESYTNSNEMLSHDNGSHEINMHTLQRLKEQIEEIFHRNRIATDYYQSVLRYHAMVVDFSFITANKEENYCLANY